MKKVSLFKRITSLALTFVMVFAIIVPVSAGRTPTDPTQNTYYLDYYGEYHFDPIKAFVEQIEDIFEDKNLSLRAQDFYVQRILVTQKALFGEDITYIVGALSREHQARIIDIDLDVDFFELVSPYAQTLSEPLSLEMVEPFTTFMRYTLNVPHRTQETRSWCGPATVQQTLQFFGVHVNQRDIARSMGIEHGGGTDIPVVRNNIRSRLPANLRYESIRVNGMDQLQALLYSSIAIQRRPPAVILWTVPGWPYQISGSGHILNISGIDVQYFQMFSLEEARNVNPPMHLPNGAVVSSFRITDPWLGYRDQTISIVNPLGNGTYWMPPHVLLSALNRVTGSGHNWAH